MPLLHPLFKQSPAIIAMIHVPALPGTPGNKFSPAKIIMDCLAEAELYQRMGVDGIMIENMHDRPYMNREVGHEISTLMAIIGREVKSFAEIPCGIQILAGANKAALAAAFAADMDFIRAEGFVFGHLADEGMMQSDAAELLRYRKMIGAEHIRIFTDIKKKHSSHAISQDIDLMETAKAAMFFKSDGLIITGNATGEEANIMDVA
ncbi:MAG: BtpA/SgcQ family protein, partial [Bacteroidota bacterium]